MRMTPDYDPKVRIYAVIERCQNGDGDGWYHWVDEETLFNFSTEEKANSFLSKLIARWVESYSDSNITDEQRMNIENGLDYFIEGSDLEYGQWLPKYEVVENYIY